MLAGGVGGTSGDILMHSLDTVKTRQQGDPHFPPKYTSLSDSYVKIFRQEGLRRGLYGGIEAAMLGSFPGTVIFFGAYEYCKRNMLDYGVNSSLSYLAAGKPSSSSSAAELFAHLEQGSLQILRRQLSTYPPRFLKLVYSFKEDTIIHSSILDI